MWRMAQMSSKLKFSVGYQLPDRYSMADVVEEFSADIDEVYFPWLGIAGGRGVSIACEDDQREMERELQSIASMGVRLNMLWNAACYGKKSLSVELQEMVDEAIRKMLDSTGLHSITTTSLFIASFVKETFSSIDVRASVNMGVGSISAVKCLEPYFDSFYMSRALNRSASKIRELHDYCALRSKKLYLLANSGCLRDCPAHMFHDNLVAHEAEIVREENCWQGFRGVCWKYLSDPDNRDAFIAESTWIRPEDIDEYSGIVDGIKLATRVHSNPGLVVDSYVNRSFQGNILGLMEPDFSSLYELEEEPSQRGRERRVLTTKSTKKEG